MSELKSLEAEMLAINVKMAKFLLPTVTGAGTVIDEEAGSLLGRLEQLRDANVPNPSELYTQITNVIEVTKNVRRYLDGERKRLEDLIKLGEKEA